MPLFTNTTRREGDATGGIVSQGGSDRDGRVEALVSDQGRLAAHFALKIGGLSKTLAVTAVSAALVFPAGSGRFLRVLLTGGVDGFIRLDKTAAVAADASLADAVTIFLPYGETLFLLMDDPAADWHLSAVTAADPATLYACVVE